MSKNVTEVFWETYAISTGKLLLLSQRIICNYLPLNTVHNIHEDLKLLSLFFSY